VGAVGHHAIPQDVDAVFQAFLAQKVEIRNPISIDKETSCRLLPRWVMWWASGVRQCARVVAWEEPYRKREPKVNQ